MTDEIRKAAIEAASLAMCAEEGNCETAWRAYLPAARAAIAAYERAMWRPVEEAP